MVSPVRNPTAGAASSSSTPSPSHRPRSRTRRAADPGGALSPARPPAGGPAEVPRQVGRRIRRQDLSSASNAAGLRDTEKVSPDSLQALRQCGAALREHEAALARELQGPVNLPLSGAEDESRSAVARIASRLREQELQQTALNSILVARQRALNRLQQQLKKAQEKSEQSERGSTSAAASSADVIPAPTVIALERPLGASHTADGIDQALQSRAKDFQAAMNQAVQEIKLLGDKIKLLEKELEKTQNMMTEWTGPRVWESVENSSNNELREFVKLHNLPELSNVLKPSTDMRYEFYLNYLTEVTGAQQDSRKRPAAPS